MGAVMAEASGLITFGNGLSQRVPEVKVVVARRFGPGWPSPARPWPTNPGCIIPYPARTTNPLHGFHARPILGSNCRFDGSKVVSGAFTPNCSHCAVNGLKNASP